MGVLKRFFGQADNFNNINTNNNNSNKTFIDSIGFNNYGIGGSEQITETEVQKVSAVKSALDIIDQTVGTLPIQLYKPDENNTPRALEDDYRMKLLNSDPNELLNGFNFKQKIAKDIVLYGESVIVVQRDSNNANNITGFYPLDMDKLDVDIYTTNGYQYIPQYTYNSLGGIYHLKTSDLLTIVQNSDNGITGRGVLDKGSQVLNLALSQHKFEQNLLNNGAMPSGILSFDSRMSKESLDNVRKQFQEANTGVDNRGKTIALELGATYTPLTINPDKMQLDISKKQMLGQIARLFNLPETMINADANKYNSNEQNNIQFFQFCLKPILESITAALNKSLLLEKEKEQGYYFDFCTDSIFQNTLDEKVKSYLSLFNEGVMTIDEIRNIFGMSKLNVEDFLKLSLGNVTLNPDTGESKIFNTMESKGGNQDQQDTPSLDTENKDKNKK